MSLRQLRRRSPVRRRGMGPPRRPMRRRRGWWPQGSRPRRRRLGSRKRKMGPGSPGERRREGRRRAIRRLPAQKTRWGGVSVPWASGSARAAAGNIPQASAAARPRLKSETARFSLMSDLLLSQAGAPSPDAELLPTCQRTVAEYTPSARFPQPRAPRSGLKGGATTWLAKCRGPLTVERQVAVEHAPPLVADIGVNLRHGPCPPRGRAGR